MEIANNVSTKPLTQKEAIFNYFTELVGGDSQTPMKDRIHKQTKKAVKAKLFAAIRNGHVRCRKHYTDQQLKNYCSTIVSDYLKKDSRYSAVKEQLHAS